MEPQAKRSAALSLFLLELFSMHTRKVTVPKQFSRRKKKAGQRAGQHKQRHMKGTISAERLLTHRRDTINDSIDSICYSHCNSCIFPFTITSMCLTLTSKACMTIHRTGLALEPQWSENLNDINKR